MIMLRQVSRLVMAAVLVCGCSSDPETPGPGGQGGQGGSGNGGKTGTGGSAMGGTGGSAAGGSGGNPGSGGAPAAGGQGGQSTGGSPGTGGQGGKGGTPGQGGQSGQGGGPATDGPTDKPDAVVDTGPMMGGTLDGCFAGLRTLDGSSQLATKRSADGKIEARIALEVDGFGTSGTKAWRLIRIGVVTPDAQVCVTDEDALRGVYKTSHHNCSDILTITAGGRTYEFKAPDTDAMRADTTLTISTGANAGTPTKLTTTSCKAGAPGLMCKSGGPC
jgi:hypothetical protein